MSRTVLLADDSVTFHKVVEICLSGENVALTAVRSAEEALTRARQERPVLVIADTVMPGGRSGYDLSAALRSDPALNGVPVLLLASPAEPFDEARAQRAGANASLPKPFQSQAFIDQVRALLSGTRPAAATQPPLSPAAARQPTMPPPARPPMPPAHATQPPPPRPAATVPPPPRPTATVPPPVRAQTLPPQARPAVPGAVRPPGIVPGARPPMPPPPPAGARPQATMPPGARPPAAVRPPGAVRPQAPGPVAAGRPNVPPPPTAVTAANHEALLREALSKASREMIEKVVWEVVPELAETLIREELARLVKERKDNG